MKTPNLLKQHNLKWIGPFIGVLYLTAPLLGMVGYGMSAVTMYTVLIPYIQPVLPWLTMPVFFLILMAMLGVLLLCFYKFVYPSYYAFLNKQTYMHQNPIQKDINLIKKKLGIEED